MDSIREIILSWLESASFTFRNNWLLENSLSFIQNVMIEHSITTLRMCNVQSPLLKRFTSRLNENSILRLCGLKISSIQNLYLDDNSISNTGSQFLLTVLIHNSNIRRLCLQNNDISDSGVVFLGEFLRISVAPDFTL